MLAVAADSTRDETLRAVGVARAKGLMCALATDADNLFVLLSARFLHPQIYVATRAGTDAVFAPYAITGHRLAQALLRPHVVQFLDFTTQAAGLNGHRTDARLRALRLGDEEHPRDPNRPAVRKGDGEMVFNPPADTAISTGDYPIVMGQSDRLHTLEGMLNGAGS
jgi:voltage-gated potassium channel